MAGWVTKIKEFELIQNSEESANKVEFKIIFIDQTQTRRNKTDANKTHKHAKLVKLTLN